MPIFVANYIYLSCGNAPIAGRLFIRKLAIVGCAGKLVEKRMVKESGDGYGHGKMRITKRTMRISVSIEPSKRGKSCGRIDARNVRSNANHTAIIPTIPSH
jgi:hypothetical protein